VAAATRWLPRFAVPSEATICRALGRLDAQALADAVGAWLAERTVPAGGDGRSPSTASGCAAPHHGTRRRRPPMHLLAAMDHTSRAVLAQRQVGGAPEEVPAFVPLLERLDLAGVVTADALRTHPEAAEFLVTREQAHDLLTVKANQPTLLRRCTELPWHRVPVLDRTRDHAHGRIEHRTSRPSPSATSGSRTHPRSSRSPASVRSATPAAAPRRGAGRP
jgi:hypothetical protein